MPSAPGVRLFVALELPAAVSGALAAWQASELRDRPGLRIIALDALHVTLAFLGQRPEGDVQPVSRALDCVSAMPCGNLALGPAVWLPRRRPRVLAVAVDDDEGELRALQSVAAGALAGAGVYEPEARIFFPHVTVARVRAGARVRPAALSAPEPIEFAGAAVTLFRSRLGGGPGGGARYEPLHRVPVGRR